jgi:hypothetical protein
MRTQSSVILAFTHRKLSLERLDTSVFRELKRAMLGKRPVLRARYRAFLLLTIREDHTWHLDHRARVLVFLTCAHGSEGEISRNAGPIRSVVDDVFFTSDRDSILA